ncbi:NAD(P)H-dependent oxidoreductase [Grimontia kaedaensis]|uniref:NAD(P)H-dependent oxidoreductase n=1 Tax=Grimontia kaedaensis TaxID=2872157 RepID=A0ABY4X2N8_9GAMM|nr:NAD(P)H-dependent oxidoreductase [Grimontia kaedaensis]USH05512.1 NAD(P)H-dependent oxidoreductase [Grimontia kaedaensis]
MKILAFAATNSRKSINKELVQYAAGKIKNADVDYVEINDFDLPIYNSDLEEDYGIPRCAYAFQKRIENADVILVSFAEHNGNFTVAFKNQFDWLSRIDRNVYQGKSIVLLATSPGPGGAKTVLKLAKEGAPHFGGNVVGTFSLPSFYDNFDQEKKAIRDTSLTAELDEILRHFEGAVSPI